MLNQYFQLEKVVWRLINNILCVKIHDYIFYLCAAMHVYTTLGILVL